METHVWLPAVVGVAGALLIEKQVPQSRRTVEMIGVAAASLAAWYFTRPRPVSSDFSETGLPIYSGTDAPAGLQPGSRVFDQRTGQEAIYRPAPTSGLGRSNGRRRWRV